MAFARCTVDPLRRCDPATCPSFLSLFCEAFRIEEGKRDHKCILFRVMTVFI